jgi:hypothetical protein
LGQLAAELVALFKDVGLNAPFGSFSAA